MPFNRLARYIYIASISLLTIFIAPANSYAYSGQGAGTDQDPYLIANCVQLQEMEDDVTAHYELADDIDCEDTSNWNGLKGFNPIGDNNAPFTGSFDGNSHVITNLTIVRADDASGSGADDEEFVGLFGYTNNAVLTDVELGSAMIKGYIAVGGVVGYMNGGTLSDSDVNRDVADNDCNPGHCIWARYGEHGGGLVGYLDGGSITNSSTDGPVKGSGVMIGGLVGTMINAQLNDSYAQGDVDGGHMIGGAVGYVDNNSQINDTHAIGGVWANDEEDFKQGQYAGGLVGHLGLGTINRSYATGEVFAEKAYVGGLVGQVMGGNIYDSYATGDVRTLTEHAGGLVGSILNTSTIERTYSSGSVTAEGSSAGGFASEARVDPGGQGITINDSFTASGIGSYISSGAFIANIGGSDITLNNNFYDINRTGFESCSNTGLPVAGCTGVNNNDSQPDYFFNSDDLAPLNDWDFETIWSIENDSYPTLDDRTDTDGDSVTDKNEEQGPNGGDANNDGTLDSVQPNVMGFFNLQNKWVSIRLDDDCNFISGDIVRESSLEAQDKDYNYPGGLVDFTASCSFPTAAWATLFFYDETVSGSKSTRKYNPLTEKYNEIYTQSSDMTIDGQTVYTGSYTICDGCSHDTDGDDSNGQFSDPIGLAIADTSETTTPTDSSLSEDKSENIKLAATGESSDFYILISVLILGMGLGAVKSLWQTTTLT